MNRVRSKTRIPPGSYAKVTLLIISPEARAILDRVEQRVADSPQSESSRNQKLVPGGRVEKRLVVIDDFQNDGNRLIEGFEKVFGKPKKG